MLKIVRYITLNKRSLCHRLLVSHLPATSFLAKRYIKTRNYQVSKKVVHEYSCHPNINNLCIVTGITILIDTLRCLKEAKTMDMILGLSVNLNIVSLFSVTYDHN